MIQREAIIEALRTLGGRATLQQIYPLAIGTGLFAGSQKPEATIRNCLLTSPKYFRHSPGKPDGWWELLSFQEELVARDNQIRVLEARVAELEARPTEAAFLNKLVAKAKRKFKRKLDIADELRDLLDEMGHTNCANELDGWIEEQKRLMRVTTLNDIHDNTNVITGR